MATIIILPETADSYRALAGDKESTGRTAGEALDALRAQLGDDESGTLAIVQAYKPDKFFTAAQQRRLTKLMRMSEAAKLSAEEERELESLVEAELVGARRRAKHITGAAVREARQLDVSANLYERFDTEPPVEQLNRENLAEVISAEIAEEVRKMSATDSQILKLYAQGLSLREIAERLNISHATAARRITGLEKRLTARVLHRLSTLEQNSSTLVDSDLG